MSNEFFVYTVDKEVVLSSKEINDIKRKDSSDKLSELVKKIKIDVDVQESYQKIRLSPDLKTVEDIKPVQITCQADDKYDMIVGQVNGIYTIKNESNKYYYCNQCERLTDDFTQVCTFCHKAFCDMCKDKSQIICSKCTDRPFY